MHIYKSRFLVRGEVWFEHEPDSTPVDWIFYHQRSRPVPGARWKYFYTIVLDLGLSPEVLRRGLNNSTAYHIRRARDRDRIVCERANPVSREMLDAFEAAYHRFAGIKGLPPLDRQWLDQLASDGFLELSLARDPEGKPLAYHAYYIDSDRSCLLHTFSLHQELADSAARNAIGRANRYLFWCDILRHQEQGLKRFDFGGWYPGKTDRELLDINRFKEGFGGQVVREYNCEQILSLKGRAVLAAAALLSWGKGLPAALRFGRKARGAETETAGADAQSPTASPGAEAPALSAPEMAR
ncbi:MAG TPA: hypothetical protein P5205_00425 [Candidatus Paceibacterota bacterium]|nr:hypothetical protein [Verrucomicrobiota bacterium]HSA08816.1 hypothetical protein [Candidatus Paceibacterota bacterium]